jgi:hypothetical protein
MSKALFRLLLISALVVAAHAQIDPTIPLRVKPVQIPDQTEAYRRTQEIRNIQLQNEQIRLQNEAIIKARNAEQQRPAPTPPTAPASTEQPEKTLGILNGRFWLSANETARLYYLIGLNNATAALGKDGVRELFLAWPATFAEMIKFVDGFYADPANGVIPVLDAIGIFTAKLHGSLPDELEARAAAFRREFTESPTPAVKP